MDTKKKQQPSENEEKEIKILTSDGKIDTSCTSPDNIKRLKQLEDEEKELMIQKEIMKKEESVKKLKKEVASKQEQKEYIISEQDEKGVVTIDNILAKEKLDNLNKKLQTTEGFWERQKIKSDISKIKTAIMTAKMNNGMIRTGNIVQKVGSTINTITTSIGKIGDSIGEIGGDYREPVIQQKSDRKTKKGKKKKMSEQNNNNNKMKDMGFTPENIFGDGKNNNYF